MSVRALTLPLLFCLVAADSPFYSVPEPTVQALKPQGLRISIPDDEGVDLVTVHANLNKPIAPQDSGQLSVDITKPKDGYWVYEDRRVRLKPGDVLNFWLWVRVYGNGYRLDDQTFLVKELVEPTSGNLQKCEDTNTMVNGNPTCKGHLIFEDNFITLNQSKWQHVVQLAGRPDYQFVLYTEDTENSVVRDDKLVITPTLMSPDDKDYIYNGHLSVPRCTGLSNSTECNKTAAAWSILPPVQSAKLHTKHSFSFVYGVIEIRAKLPRGDWLFPEIWLEPKENYYGDDSYQSGQIRIAMARGNEDLTKDEAQLGNNVLEAGCRIGLNRKIRNDVYTKRSGIPFGSDFHVYKVIWDTDQLVFFVDDMEIGKVHPPLGGFGGLEEFASSPTVPWKSNMAPFDREFYITLGVGIGGYEEFPDECISNQHPKPWRNRETKSMLHFYNDLNNWYPTWDSHKSALEVDYVKVWAI